jgi:hypothetical protein
MPGEEWPGRSKERSLPWQRENKGDKMTVAELMHHNFNDIFIELDPVKREAMMRNAYTEDCVWIHPGGRLVGIAAINEAASEIRKRIPEYRYRVVGDIHTMHNVGTFWRNATAVLLCSTPSSIVELRRSRRRNRALAFRILNQLIHVRSVHWAASCHVSNFESRAKDKLFEERRRNQRRACGVAEFSSAYRGQLSQ